MNASSLPVTKFQQSYQDLESYPKNLLFCSTYRAALNAYSSRLDSQADLLFAKDATAINVPIKDYEPTGGVGRKYGKFMVSIPAKNVGVIKDFQDEILSDEALKRWLGGQSATNLNISTRASRVATKRDPKCRFIFLCAKNSKATLNITRLMLVRILSYHQVMPEYLDFISVFGKQSKARDLRFAGFREQTILNSAQTGLRVPNLGRSGRGFQLCYNLKTVGQVVSKSSMPRLAEWSIRQAAFHHQFDIEEGTTLWIITRGAKDIKERIENMAGADGRLEDYSFDSIEASLKSSLAVHLLNAHWSTEGWRSYIRWLEDVVEDETDLAAHAPRGPGFARQKYNSDHIQSIQDREDRTNIVIMVLEANADVLTALKGFYDGLLGDKAFDPLSKGIEEAIRQFSAQLNAMISDSRMQISRARLLVQIISGRKSLISQHYQTQATENMEGMTKSMHQIGIISQKETIAMRIITVVTLIYLPPTFVSTFFSTDIIQYQNQNNDSGTFSRPAMQRWLEVTLPLTLITLVLGYFAFHYEDGKRNKELLKFREMDNNVSWS